MGQKSHTWAPLTNCYSKVQGFSVVGFLVVSDREPPCPLCAGDPGRSEQLACCWSPLQPPHHRLAYTQRCLSQCICTECLRSSLLCHIHAANTLNLKFETNVPRNETARPRSQFLQLCICERVIYFHQRVTKRCLGWPIAPSYMSPYAGGEVAGSQPMSTAVHMEPE